jgi:hypothetical protein
MVPEASDFLKRLREGGTIVSSNDCSADEIALALRDNRFFVDTEGFGYVYRSGFRVTIGSICIEPLTERKADGEE